MFTKVVEYEDVFTGNTLREELCFNLTVPEIAELEFEFNEGLQEYVRKAVEEQSNKKIFDMFKILMAISYGRRSPDGTRFLKRKEWLDELFCGTAYEALFIWLFSDPRNATEFFTKVQPKNLEEKLKALTPKDGETAVTKNKVELDNLTENDLQAMLERVRNKLPANQTGPTTA